MTYTKKITYDEAVHRQELKKRINNRFEIGHLSEGPGLGNFGTLPKSTPAQYIRLGILELWTSYDVVIAFRYNLGEIVTRENEWGNTTGRHINAVQPDKSARIDGIQFMMQLASILERQ